MNRTTLLSVAIALGSLVAAIVMRPVEIPPAVFQDTGELLFPKFTDPAQAASLEVIGYDETGARATTFKVEQKAGRWVIPSHNDYPADGAERMGKAAASFIDAKRDVLRSDRVEDHASFGVEDPQAPSPKGAGQRIIIKDPAGTILVDAIVGKKPDDKEGFRYVRLIGENAKRVYASKLEVDISTNFTDWIEKDLLKLEQDSVVSFVNDPYKVDETKGQVQNRDPLLLKKQPDPEKPDDKNGMWVIAEGTPVAGKDVDPFKIRQVLGAIDRLQIVGVRPRPEPLTFQALQSKGFFVTPDGRRLFGNEGEVKAICDDGVVYTLYFGEITLDSGLALTAGTPEDKPKEDKPEGEDEKKDANRFMFVDVTYDIANDKAASESGGGAETEGFKRAKSLKSRFDKWFYVISDANFKQIHKDKAELFKEPAAATGGTPATPAKAGTPAKPAAPGAPAKAPAKAVTPPKPAAPTKAP
jgi:hypothetical protein